MEKLAKIFQERLGMSEELSLKASNIALEFVKEQLPDAIAPHIDTLIKGEDLGDMVSGALGDKLGGGLGGLFGGDD